MDGKVYKRALATCITMLLLSIALKLFGVQWFDLNTNIPLLQEIDNIVMNNTILSFLYSFTLLWINGILVILCTIKQIPYKYIYAYTCFIIISITCGSSIITSLLDTLTLLLISYMILPNKRTILNFVGVFLLNITYQFISLYIRDLGFHLSNYGMTCSLLFMIDYYLMLLTTYLYLKKGNKDICSISLHFGSYLASKLCKKPLNESSRNK